MGSPQQKYTAEYRAEAVKLVLEKGLSITEAADKLNMIKQTLHNWVIKAKHGSLPMQGSQGESAVDLLSAENRRLKRALSEAEMERDILKKAAAYFAKESLQGTRS
jgi:transposase